MREIELKPSRLLGLLLAAMTALALAVVWLAAIPAGAQLGLAAAVLGLAVWNRPQADQGARLRLTAEGRLQALDDEGEWRDAEVEGDSFVAPGLVVMRYRIDGRPARSLTLLPDSARAEDLRRLRVSLRWARRTRSGTSFPGAG